MTSEVFDKNDFCGQYNVSLEEVKEDRNYYERFLFSTSFVFIYSAFRIYTEDLFRFTRDVVGKLEDKKESELKSLLDEIGGGLEGEMGEEIVETLDYIRHLRNQHVHGTGEPSDKMRDIKRRKGETLNKYWEN
ncbi:hypothetical protein GGP86_002807 [Salinibacter ruber]|nr:hypothetical protein [Salinibacter ruber]